MPSTVVTCTAAWLVPGGGHILLGRWKRGLLFLGVVMFLFVLGLHQEGVLFGLTPGLFGFLKFFADLCLGAPYIIGKLAGWGQGDIRSYAYEYGNTYLYTAGLINSLLVLDAFDIVKGRKS
jgi:hypothetical protein